MKNKISARGFAFLALLVLATGCEKNESFYYADPQTPGVAILSNKGNNILTCFMNGHPWKTLPRTINYGFGRSTTELQIRRTKTNSLTDTLTITWRTDASNQDQYDIVLTLPVAKNFQPKDMAAYQGKRIEIDSTNGYFSLNQSYSSFSSYNGKGVIYFNTANLDSTGIDNITGRISGLLEANFYPGSNIAQSITSGRFDDNISALEFWDF